MGPVAPLSNWPDSCATFDALEQGAHPLLLGPQSAGAAYVEDGEFSVHFCRAGGSESPLCGDVCFDECRVLGMDTKDYATASTNDNRPLETMDSGLDSLNRNFADSLLERLNQKLPHLSAESQVDFMNSEILEFTSTLGKNVKVYGRCAAGTCKCVHVVGKNVNQLKPCRFACILKLAGLGEACDGSFSNLLNFVTDGFPVVDSDVAPYDNVNYNSILQPEYKSAMDEIVRNELAEGMISKVTSKPTCIHALGAVPKSRGGMRAITDCSRPIGRSVNNHCLSLFRVQV